MLTEKQRAHARRNALQDAPAYAKGRTVTPEKITQYTEYQASLIAPKREPARTQWKEEYTYHFTAYMLNSGAMEPEPPAPKVQVTKDGPAYLLPGIEPAGKQKGEATQTAMF